jgi:hypothetical protein
LTTLLVGPTIFLSALEPDRIERSAPFCADFAIWLSMITVVGLGSRPVRSRDANALGRAFPLL